MDDYVLSTNEAFETFEEQEEVNQLLPQSQQYERILIEEAMENISNNNFEQEQEDMFPGGEWLVDMYCDDQDWLNESFNS